jgi:hypothetical protein
MSKQKSTEQTPAPATPAAVQPIGTPPGGGSWRWDAAKNDWVANAPDETIPTTQE